MWSDAIVAMGRDLTGLATPPSADLGTARNARILADAAGSGRAAARMLGVAESTFRGWLGGVTPKRGGAFLVTAARLAASATNRPGHLKDAMDADVKTLTIRGLVVVSSDAKIRTIYPGRWIPRIKIRNMLRAWIAGDDARAARLMGRAIETHYVSGMTIDHIEWVTFE